MVRKSCDRRAFFKSVGAGASMALAGSAIGAPGNGEKPNVLLVIGDDMNWRDCEPYGSKQVKTPNMQKLADEGMRFDRMFTSTAMCAPTRQQLYTGMWPVRNGAYPNHSGVYKGVKSLPHHLKALGYRVGLIGKTHFKPKESYPFDMLAGGKGGASNTKAIARFVNSDKSQPYCLIVCSNEPHGPYTMGDPNLYDPDKIEVPPYLVDTPTTRRVLAKYMMEITYLDGQLGECMKIVDESGRRDNTMVVFTSEQGSGFPFGGKWTCYENGLKTDFIVRWPGRVKAGSANEALTQYIDFVPTVIEAAGGDPTTIDTGCPDAKGYRGFDGRSFLGVLEGKTDSHRDYVFGAHTTRGIINGSDCYPVRSVRSKTHKLIWNPNHEVTFTNAVTRTGENSIFGSWIDAGKTDPKAAARAKAYQYRPEWELYDLTKDEYELNNLADDPAYAQIKVALKKELDRWMAQQGDEGNATEMKAFERQGRNPDGSQKKTAAKKKAARKAAKKE